MKRDCPVCGQDVFCKSVVHVQGNRREVVSTGWCRQCGHGLRRREVFRTGVSVLVHTSVLPPKKGKP